MSRSGALFAIEGLTTRRSAPPKVHTVWVPPPMQVTAMRSIDSGTATSRPFASTTAPSLAGASSSAGSASSSSPSSDPSASARANVAPPASANAAAPAETWANARLVILVSLIENALLSHGGRADRARTPSPPKGPAPTEGYGAGLYDARTAPRAGAP